MDLGRGLRRWTTSMLRPRGYESELDEELRASLEILTDRYIARGVPAGAARRAARMEFEGVDQVKDRVRDRLVGASAHAFVRDARNAWRGLRRNPSFACIAVLTLALGIGVNTAIFSVFYGMLLEPLPYGHPEQLVRVWGRFHTAGDSRAPLSGAILGRSSGGNARSRESPESGWWSRARSRAMFRNR